MLQFIEQLLPLTGYICCAKALSVKGFSHRFFVNPEDAVEYLQEMDRRGHTMYLAQGSFSPQAMANYEYNQTIPFHLSKEERKQLKRPERTQNNVMFLRNFFLDVDCGENKPYANQDEALDALLKFCRDTSLPKPTVVNSGHGLYAHWFIDQDIDPNVWEANAEILKQVCVDFNFHTDPSRTSDRASVLRPIGVHNRKHGMVKPVCLMTEITEPIPLLTFTNTMASLAKHKKYNIEAFTPPKKVALEDNPFLVKEIPTAYAEQAADKCAQLRFVRDCRGNVTEPLWYHMIGIVKHSIEGTELIHKWSEGHPDYSFAATEAKIAQWVLPPSTCAGLSASDPSRCIGCKYKNKVSSPLQLGLPTPVEYNPLNLPSLPAGFIRTENGIFYQPHEDEPIINVYPHEIHPVAIGFDHNLGCETTTIKHFMPHEGWKEFTIKSSIVHDPKVCITELHNNHVQVLGVREKKALVMYVEGFMEKLKREGKMSHLVSQMGWIDNKDEPQFALGPNIISSAGSQYAGFSKSAPDLARFMVPVGDIQKWIGATAILGEPGMEPLAFALLCGAFGAPLLKFTGLAGALISMVGPSGAGKSLIGYWAMSAYGHPDKLALMNRDTSNFLVSRLGFYGNLPLFLDEVTNIDGMELSDMVYRITQGRDKGRLDRNAREKAIINSWQTLVISSSNTSLIDKLGCAKVDASAEINRVFEYKVNRHPLIDQESGADLHFLIRENHGAVGLSYIDYLIEHYHEHKDKLRLMTGHINNQVKAQSEERFWSGILSTAAYGGAIAKKLGLIKFDVSPAINWAMSNITEQRETKIDYVNDSISVLGQFIDRNFNHCLIIQKSTARPMAISKEPRGSLGLVVYADIQKMWISRDFLRKDLSRTFASYDALKMDLLKCGALVSHGKMKNLASGTYFAGVSQMVWEIDLANPALQAITMQVVDRLEQEAHRPTEVVI